MQRLWSMKTVVIPVVIGATGYIPQHLRVDETTSQNTQLVDISECGIVEHRSYSMEGTIGYQQQVQDQQRRKNNPRLFPQKENITIIINNNNNIFILKNVVVFSDNINKPTTAVLDIFYAALELRVQKQIGKETHNTSPLIRRKFQRALFHFNSQRFITIKYFKLDRNEFLEQLA